VNRKKNDVNWRNIMIILGMRYIISVNFLGATFHPDEHH